MYSKTHEQQHSTKRKKSTHKPMSRRLTSEEVAKIVLLRAVGFSQKEISKEIKVSPGTISYHMSKHRELAKEMGAENAFWKLISPIATENIVRLCMTKKY